MPITILAGKMQSSIAPICLTGTLFNMKKILAILFLFFCFACRNNGMYQPYTMALDLPDGPPEYKAGWRAGCRSGLSAGGRGFFANSFVYPNVDYGDGVYHHDSLFVSGWLDAAFTCFEFNSTFGGIKPTFQAPLE